MKMFQNKTLMFCRFGGLRAAIRGWFSTLTADEPETTFGPGFSRLGKRSD